MAIFTVHKLTVLFGILGNIVAGGVFLSPAPTFFRIYQHRSSEGYHSLPYVVALFSTVMQLYYGSLKPGGMLLITINIFGCLIEIIYLSIFLIYSPQQTKSLTLKLIILFNLGGCALIILPTILLSKGSTRLTIVGWISAIINLCVFAAPLSVMRQVITTRSVEFMPISLSLALTLNAIVWFFYGFFLKDRFIAGPNIIGFLLGMIQISLYIIYKFCLKNIEKDPTNAESTSQPKEDVVRDTQQIELNVF